MRKEPAFWAGVGFFRRVRETSLFAVMVLGGLELGVVFFVRTVLKLFTEVLLRLREEV